MNLIFLGAPGAGKGTQAQLIEKKFNIIQISTGDILRQAVKDATELGKTAKEYMDQGALVPDDVVIGIIKDRILQDDCKNGFILDGFPRTTEQASALDAILEENSLEIDHVININVPQEELIQRLLKRAEIEGRSDDNIDSIKNRLSVFEEKTLPLINYYRKSDKLRDINGLGDIDTITSDIEKVLG